MNGFACLTSLVRRWLGIGKRARTGSHQPEAGGRPFFEPLEDRRLLAAGILYVDHDPAGLGNGSSWANAFTDLQSALNTATAGNQIWVSAGTYKPTQTTNRSVSISLKSGVSLYGGFAGGETSLAQRDCKANITTLSGDIGVPGDSRDNSYHVVYASGVTEARLDGFSVTCGNASAGYGDTSGGGMLNRAGSSPTVANCEFVMNSARYSGGGMANNDSAPVIVDCVFRQNSAAMTGNGGALSNYSSSPTLTNVAISGNTAVNGGALYNYSSSPRLLNVTLANNRATGSGGAIASVSKDSSEEPKSQPSLTNAILWGNSANSSPEIYDDSDSSTAVTYSIVAGGHSGAGNLESDPLLVGANYGNMHLSASSPAIDAGYNTGAPTSDLDGLPRPQDGNCDGRNVVDMGAFEYPCPFNDALLTDVDVGAGKFIVTAVFSEPMSTATIPTIGFSQDVGSTLTLAEGNWLDDQHFVAEYDVADANVSTSTVTASVSGARNASGTLLPNQSLRGTFRIDTVKPTVADVSVRSGDGYFSVEVTYSEDMDRTALPTIKNLTPSPATAYTVASASWLDSKHYKATYHANDKIFNLGIKVKCALDLAGNVQVEYSGLESISTGDASGASRVGLFDPVSSAFCLSENNTANCAERTIAFGEPNAGCTSLLGDWDGDGFTDIGLYDPDTSTFQLTDAATEEGTKTFGFGNPGGGWIPLAGDWDGDGASGVGLYDPSSSTFYLTNDLRSGIAQHAFGFGNPGSGWIPLVGDWDGDGVSGAGLYNPHSSTFYLTNAFVSGFARYTFGYGMPDAGWQPLVGDWDGDTMMSVGLYDPATSTFYLANTLTTCYAQYTFGYGVPSGGWIPVVGDWDGNHAAGVGLYDPVGSTFYLTNSLSSGYAEVTIGFCPRGTGLQPLVGCWPASDQQADLTASAVDAVELASVAQSALDLDSTALVLDLEHDGSPSDETDTERLTDIALQRL